MKPSFGNMEGFYDLAKGISDGLQEAPDSSKNKTFASGDEVMKKMFETQTDTFLFWSIGFLIVLIALVFGIVTCVCQCCCSCSPKETSFRAECTGYVYAFLLVAVFSFILTGLILFNESESDLFDSTDNLVAYTGDISRDLTNVVGNGTLQIACEVTGMTVNTFEHMNTLIQNYSSNVFDGTKEKVGINDVNNFSVTNYESANTATQNAATALNGKLQKINSKDQKCTDNVKTLTDQFDSVNQALTGLTAAALAIKKSKPLLDINVQIDIIKNNVQDQANKASKAINSTQKQINKSMKSITKMMNDAQKNIDKSITSMESAYQNFVVSSGYSSLKTTVHLLVSIPACIVCFFCFVALVAVLLSLKKQDGAALKLPCFIIISFYLTIIICIFLILLSSLSFVLGWFVSAVCVPMFEDPSYQLFRPVNNTVSAIGSGDPVKIDFGNVLQLCHKETMTLYTAIDGKKVISTDSITRQLKLDFYRDNANKQIMKQKNLTFVLEPSWKTFITTLDKNTQDAKSAVLDSCGDSDAVDKYNSYIQNLVKSNTMSTEFYRNLETLSRNAPNTTVIATTINNDYFNEADLSISQSISALMTNLEQHVFKCRPLVDIYNNGGFVMCEKFGKPIHGLWASIGLAGVFSFFLTILLLLTYRWLKKHKQQLD
ncbi:hypothetical protein GCK72_005466 [Caenorhabditis remanei]|uniref:Uncharacterized protein n=1 Tax=Caenorhabditis remanei TaxID=31234 RepID=A0A6A5HFI7_CAERE|nr:hypothetical protein GCK72_005466 [Caenorhabditis remanei]KAF1765514.1 hypothetical protein GCK72_005466 [Caenorhabditis remanei]